MTPAIRHRRRSRSPLQCSTFSAALQKGTHSEILARSREVLPLAIVRQGPVRVAETGVSKIDFTCCFAACRQGAVRELAEEQFIAHNVKTPARSRIFELFAQHRTPLNISIELATLETIKDFVLFNAGIAILPRLVVKEAIRAGSLVEVPVKEMKIEKVLRIIYRCKRTLSHAARSFLEMVKNGPLNPPDGKFSPQTDR